MFAVEEYGQHHVYDTTALFLGKPQQWPLECSAQLAALVVVHLRIREACQL